MRVGKLREDDGKEVIGRGIGFNVFVGLIVVEDREEVEVMKKCE